MTAAKGQHKGQQTLKSSNQITIKLSGKEMNQTSQYKTVLAPNAPWPKMESQKPDSWQKVKAVMQTKEWKEIGKVNNLKTRMSLRKRDSVSGRFTSN